jgi:threonyl-tRNA synthetase
MLADDDHRSLAHRLDLLHFDEDAPGMAFWHPRGYALYRLLEEAARRHFSADGYREVRTPQILRRPVWEASGHWQHFAEGMFRLQDESCPAAVKPVSCPGHIGVARRAIASYRDLPLRLAELGLCHRDEPGGTLHGMLRLRQFTQDDGHVFCAEDQIAGELERFCRSVAPFYARFGFTEVAVALSRRPAERAGDDALWDRAEGALVAVLAKLGIAHVEQPGAGAFYGPKIEWALADRQGRSWQCGTIQVDLVMPGRFDLRYPDASGEKRPVCILHRALYGSLERFMALLLEHHRGALPPWLAPLQVAVLPVGAAHHAWAASVEARLGQVGLRVALDARNESLGKRIAEAHGHGVPFVAVVGDREQAAGGVALRSRGGGQEALSLEAALATLERRCAG